MFIEILNNNSTKYLRLVQSKRVPRLGKKTTVTKEVILNIGPLSRFDDGQPNYIERLRESFKNGNPLIPSLKEFSSGQPATRQTYNFKISEGSEECVLNPKIFGHKIIDKILLKLGLIKLVVNYKSTRKITFDILGYFRLLIFGRIIYPASKIATAGQGDKYFGRIVDDDGNEFNIYKVLDFIYEMRSAIQMKINESMCENFGRSLKKIYYDVTNLYFEIERPDEDVRDENGNVIEYGIRKPGHSKENRKEPIVQAGLFMDEQGIPVSIEMFPGNTLDHQTFQKACCNSVPELDNSRFIYVADGGIYNRPNAMFVKDHGNGYVMSLSLKKVDEKTQDWAIKPEGFIQTSKDFKYKSREVIKKVKDSQGNIVDIREKEVVYWKRSYYERSMAENQSFMEFVAEYQKNPARFRWSTKYDKVASKYLRKEVVDKRTGEVISKKEIEALIDEDKLNRDLALMGFYMLVSSELEMDDMEIIGIYHGLSKIEDEFRIMKGTMMTRPIFVRKPEHIMAHLLCCMIALVVIRLMQRKIQQFKEIGQAIKKATISAFTESKGIKRNKYWEFGLSANRLQEALRNFQCSNLGKRYFSFCNMDNEDVKLLVSAFEMEIPKKLFSPREIQIITGQIKVN